MADEEIRVVEVDVSESDFLQAQTRSIAAHERIEAANRQAREIQEGQQRRIIALNYALASLGLGGNALNPLAQPTPEGGAFIVRRAREFDAYIRGADAEIIPITTPRAVQVDE